MIAQFYQQLRRKLLLLLAWFCVVSGIVGIFVPLLPTTPFLLAAAWCFARTSERWHRWLSGNVYLNSYLLNHRLKTGVPREIIFRALLVLWGINALIVALWWMHTPTPVGISLLISGVVTWHLLSLRRSSRQPLRFTLIELLISMGVIAVLASMLLPALQKARDTARESGCLNNLKQIGAAVDFYCLDHRDQIPDIPPMGPGTPSIPILRFGPQPVALGKLIDAYGMPPEVFGCPFNEQRSGAYVAQLWHTPRAVVHAAYLYRGEDAGFYPKRSMAVNAGKAMVMDFACLFSRGRAIEPHSFRSTNLLYVDGHVEKRANNRTPNELYTTEVTGNFGMVPPCEEVWQHADQN